MIRPKIENGKKKAAVSEEKEKKKYLLKMQLLTVYMSNERREKVDKE